MTTCDPDGHTPVAGMAYVHPEDLDTVAAQRASQRQRPVECDTCGRVYVRGEWRSE